MESTFKANSIITVKVDCLQDKLKNLPFMFLVILIVLIALHGCCHFLLFSKYEMLSGKCDETKYNYPSNR